VPHRCIRSNPRRRSLRKGEGERRHNATTSTKHRPGENWLPRRSFRRQLAGRTGRAGEGGTWGRGQYWQHRLHFGWKLCRLRKRHPRITCGLRINLLKFVVGCVYHNPNQGRSLPKTGMPQRWGDAETIAERGPGKKS